MCPYAIVAWLCVSAVSAPEPVPQAEGSSVRKSTATELSQCLDEVAKLDDAAQQIKLMQAAAETACRSVPENVLLPEMFAAAEKNAADASAALRAWKLALGKAADLLKFEPVVEAPLPEGFPALTPVGEIRVLNYPAYRLARTEMNGRGNGAFWTLFMHIKKREIAMTAPVETTYDAEGAKQQTMAFLYRNVRQGRLEAADAVKVVDVPAMTVVSFGMRGDADPRTVADAREKLETWLKAHANEYETDGPLRVMGHNSPFITASKRYHEVQMPIRSLLAR